MKLTHADFAQRLMFIASKASSWAADSLTLPEYRDRAIDPATAARFTDEIRGSLDRIDELAGRRALSDREGT